MRSFVFFFLVWPIVCRGLELGWTASMSNWPFIAAIFHKPKDKDLPKLLCTGTIIDDLHILTTEYCMVTPVNGKPPFQTPDVLKIWVGSGFRDIDNKEGGDAQLRDVSEVLLPSDQDLKKTIGIGKNNFTGGDGFVYRYLDFSILRLDKEILYNKHVIPARFDVRSYQDSQKQYVPWKRKLDEEIDWIPDCFMAGWGYDETKIQKLHEKPNSQRLLFNRLKFTPRSKCDLAYCSNCSLCGNSTEHLPNIYWCFSSQTWPDTCPGDHGAPLYCPWFGFQRGNIKTVGAIFGILSGKPGTCNKARVPGKFTAIWFAYNFIERVLNKGKFPPPIAELGDPDWAY
ncbi:hypothetical protein GE061_006359 [Apolygus lucorum]|uniref:Peptidase S1 domain-containing protein n=1 Tax=Apolygus lucorum TaxID=248454 RepID=A0A8S9WV30_APOLU|nr:hypothetical protein GE061_006359 [Apolygus lucorum]